MPVRMNFLGGGSAIPPVRDGKEYRKAWLAFFESLASIFWLIG
jgi:hypothetical protein